MPRARTGTLLPPGADGLWRCRVTAERADGTTWRPIYSLGTADKALARRKLSRVNAELAAGRNPFEAADAAHVPERVKDYAEAWLGRRVDQGVVSVDNERRNLERWVLPAIGAMPLSDVRPLHVRAILESVATGTYETGKIHVRSKRYRAASVAKVRSALHLLFRSATEAGLIEHNPVAAVGTPRTREVHKERAILTDEEFSRFVSCAGVDLELRMLALVARCEGGMRAGDLNSWDWSMIDRLHFAECFIPRAKTRRPQALAIPEALAPFLRGWWERAGKPENGPVFPVRCGKRAGDFRTACGGFARRLRRDLFRAGVYRLPPIEVPATHPGMRSDLGKAAAGTQPAPNPRDPLYYETATTLPVDWHSFRRAFASALAEAGVNVQQAMHLAAHSDPRVHARYVMRTAAMRKIPDAALPRLPVALLAAARPSGERGESSRPIATNSARIVTARDDSRRSTLRVIENGNDSGGRSRDRTCDFVRVKDALYR
jgi:integrase